MKFILVIAMLSACKDHLPTKWFGLPPNVEAHCVWQKNNDDLGTCVAGVKAFTCVRTLYGDDQHEWTEVHCAPQGAPLPAEVPDKEQ